MPFWAALVNVDNSVTACTPRIPAVGRPGGQLRALRDRSCVAPEVPPGDSAVGGGVPFRGGGADRAFSTTRKAM